LDSLDFVYRPSFKIKTGTDFHIGVLLREIIWELIYWNLADISRKDMVGSKSRKLLSNLIIHFPHIENADMKRL